MNIGGDRHSLIVEALLELGKATQTDIEEWIEKIPDLADLLGKEHTTREKINSWVAVYINRMRKRGIVEVVGTTQSRQSALREAKLFGLARGICPCCGSKIPEQLLDSGVVDSPDTKA